MPLVLYSALRVGLLVVAWAALVLAGLNPWVSAVGAVLVAFALSYVLLRGPRDAAAAWLAERDTRRRARRASSVPPGSSEADAAAEDAAVEAAARDGRPGAGPGTATPSAG